MFEARVQRQFDAMNRRDLAAIMSIWADDATWEFPGKTPMSGRFEGKPAIQAWFERWISRFTDVHFTVRHVAVANPLALNISNTMFVAWDVEVRTVDGIAAAGSGISFIQVRRGKAIFGRDYFFNAEMLELVWGRRDEPADATTETVDAEPIAVPA